MLFLLKSSRGTLGFALLLCVKFDDKIRSGSPVKKFVFKPVSVKCHVGLHTSTSSILDTSVIRSFGRDIHDTRDYSLWHIIICDTDCVKPKERIV